MLPFVKVITRVKVSNNVQYDKKTNVFQYHIVLRIVNEWNKWLYRFLLMQSRQIWLSAYVE